MNEAGIKIVLVSVVAVLMVAAALWAMAFLPSRTPVPMTLPEVELTTFDLDGLPTQAPLRSGECWKRAVCGALTYVDCGIDGPEYYVNTETEDVVASCGFACIALEQQEYCARNCPPRAWTCEVPSAR